MKEIEPKILPLVQALNSTGLVYTFSSCQGHFDQFHRFKDKNKAEVRFYPEDNSSKNEIEKFFCYLLSKFNDQYGFSPVILSAYKLYTSLKPNENEIVDYVYALELIPVDQGITPEEKRSDIDKAILDTTDIVKNYGDFV